MANLTKPNYENTPISDLRNVQSYSLVNSLAEPKVSIITPFYDTGIEFGETASSIFQQSFQQWEWIIVNDASRKEESIDQLNQISSLGDPRISVYNLKKNKGVSHARNLGVSKSKSKFILLLDSDDLLEPTTIEKWYWFLESHNDFSFVNGYSIGFGSQTYLWDKGYKNKELFLESNMVDIVSLIRKDIYNKVGGFNESNRDGLEDWDFWLKCADSGYWGYTIPEVHDWYRRRASHNDRWENWDENGEKQNEFRKLLKQKYPKLWDGGFPDKVRNETQFKPPKHLSSPFNLLEKNCGRALVFVPWLRDDDEGQLIIQFIQTLKGKGWDVSVIATATDSNLALSDYSETTSDIFILNNFLSISDYPKFLDYFIQSRNFDFALISSSELGYLMSPFLKKINPDLKIFDICQQEDVSWKEGGYIHYSSIYQSYLNSTFVTSSSLKKSLRNRGASNKSLSICKTGAHLANNISLALTSSPSSDVEPNSDNCKTTELLDAEIATEIIRLTRINNTLFHEHNSWSNEQDQAKQWWINQAKNWENKSELKNKEVSELKDRLLSLQKIVDDQKNVIRTKSDQAHMDTEKLSQLETTNLDLSAQIQNLKNEIVNINSERNFLKLTISQLAKNRDEQKSQIEILTSQSDLILGSLSTQASQLNGMISENKKLTTENTHLNFKLERAEQNLKDAKSWNQKLKESNQWWESKAKNNEKTTSELRVSLEKKGKWAGQLKEAKEWWIEHADNLNTTVELQQSYIDQLNSRFANRIQNYIKNILKNNKPS